MTRTPGAAADSRRLRAALLVLAVLTWAAFLPVKDAEFINFDDPDYVTNNHGVLNGLSPGGLIWALSTFEAANWHPLTWISHMLDVTLFGLHAGGHHLTSLALHTAAAMTLLLLLEGLTGRLWPGFLTAALFAVHPLRVESVAWISERKDVLSGLLGLLALLAYLRYARRPGPGRFALVATLLGLGLMAKPMLVTLPFVLLLLDWWPLGRVHRASSPRAVSTAAAARRLLLEKAPLLALAAASCVVTYLAQRHGGAMAFTENFSPAVRFNNAAVSYVRYLGKMLWPQQLIPFYPHPGLVLTHTQVALSLALLAALTAGAVASRRRHPWLITGWLWFLGMLVPVIGLVQVGLQGMADRYSYLPLIGLSMALCWEAATRAARSAPGRALLATAAVCVLAALAFLTWNQSRLWQSSLALFSRVVAVDPRNYLAYNMLGSDYLLRGDTERAVALYKKSLELKPGYFHARYNLGLALARRGERAAAIVQFTSVINYNPNDEESLYNRGRLFLELGRAGDALRDFDAARALAPAQPQVHYKRGLALAQLGRYAEAADAFGQAVALDPNNAEAQFGLGRALDALGRGVEASDHFRAALELTPGSAEAHNMLGVELADQGRLTEAIGHFEEAVRLDPRDAEARANLERARRKLAPPR